MAIFENSRKRLSAIGGASIAIVLAAMSSCAQITALGDDYQYDLDNDSSADASNPTDSGDGGVPTDGDGSIDARLTKTCTAAETAAAAVAVDEAGGADLTTACKDCLSSTCCSEIATCGSDDACAQSMKCVFNCQKNGNGKAQCLNGCGSTFSSTVGACTRASCASSCRLF